MALGAKGRGWAPGRERTLGAACPQCYSPGGDGRHSLHCSVFGTSFLGFLAPDLSISSSLMDWLPVSMMWAR